MEKDNFLNYEHVHVHFIYSFTWDITKLKFDKLKTKLTKNKKTKWEECLIYERPINWRNRKLNHYYHPNLISENKNVLQKNVFLKEINTVCIPIEPYMDSNVKKYISLPINLQYTIRLFENGTGTCTFICCLDKREANFTNIHRILRLSPNISNKSNSNFTDSFILNPFFKTFKTSNTIFKKFINKKFITLQQIFWCLFNESFSNELKSDSINITWKDLWLDDNLLELSESSYNWQSPFVFTIAEINKEDYNEHFRYVKNAPPCENTVKEISSIACKLTLDNLKIDEEYKNLDLEYIKQNLGYSEKHHRLKNFCLDERLFFTFSRRGAIAITDNLYKIPSSFVVPSLLNLLEILRSRWHLCNIVNLGLDQAIYKLVSCEEDVPPTNLLNEIYKWRTLFALYLRDPIASLFDGGSIIEIAEIAEEKLWLNKLTSETYRKFDTLDKLLRDYLERKRIEMFFKDKLKSN